MGRCLRGMTLLHQHLFKSCHPSLLAMFRIFFGIFMMMDAIQERGMSRADVKYGVNSSRLCSFPLIHELKPFRFEIMVVLYATLFWNSFFVAIGYFYRLNIISYTAIYWYLFILDTSTWNNHSYLFGLIGILLCVSKPHRYMSVDNIIFKPKTTDVPFWNYMLLRFQVFLVYFYAGLKKTEADWLTGYSMTKMSRKWVFDPLRPFMSNENIDFWIVHICGFLFDTTVGFMLLFKKTRIIGLILCASFHGMNSFMFSIGMFPYMMMVSSFIFCDPRSFHVVLSRICSCWLSLWNNATKESSKAVTITKNVASQKKDIAGSKGWTFSQMLAAIFCVVYMTSQSFLPYSHFITKGYNGWTRGLYGYSWDMMVHTFANQHVKVMYKDLDTGEVGYLKPNAFLRSKRYRWTIQPAMAYQYAVCIKERLKKLGINNSAVHFDVWKSMNKRMKQRIYDPDADIANYKWSPFVKPAFVLPLMAELSNWREELAKIKKKWKKSKMKYHVVFVADFPGLYLDNYVSEDVGDATLHVLKGKVLIHNGQMKTNLSAGGTAEVQPGRFHRVETVSQIPSCYYYIYVNKTVNSLEKQANEYGSWLERQDGNYEYGEDFPPEVSKEAIDLYHKKFARKPLTNSVLEWNFSKFFQEKFSMVQKCYFLFWFSVRNIIFGMPPDQNLVEEAEIMEYWDGGRKHRLHPNTEGVHKVEL